MLFSAASVAFSEAEAGRNLEQTGVGKERKGQTKRWEHPCNSPVLASSLRLEVRCRSWEGKTHIWFDMSMDQKEPGHWLAVETWNPSAVAPRLWGWGRSFWGGVSHFILPTLTWRSAISSEIPGWLPEIWDCPEIRVNRSFILNHQNSPGRWELQGKGGQESGGWKREVWKLCRRSWHSV